MNRTKACLALALGLAALEPAHAADLTYGGGSIKDGSGIPVPAPIPVAETFRWYLRADIGMGVVSRPDVSERGLVYGQTDSIAPFGTDSSWFRSDFDTYFNGGVGAGLYLTPRLRGDVTFDWRTKSEVTGDGRYQYAEYTPLPIQIPTTNIIRGTMAEHTEVHGTVGLVNLYYDLTDRGRFTPYVGIGAGFVIRQVDRDHMTTETLFDAGNTVIGTRSFTGHSKANSIAPAAAATAGFTYPVSAGMLLDFNYRFTYLGAVESATVINGQRSTLSIGDTYEHAVRAGLRWNVW